MRDKTCGMLGGTITMGAVNFPGIFFAWGKQIISGIGWELVVKTLNEEGKHPPAPADIASLPIQHHVKINPSRGLFQYSCAPQEIWGYCSGLEIFHEYRWNSTFRIFYS